MSTDADSSTEPTPRRRYRAVMAGIGIAIGATMVTGIAVAEFTVPGGGEASGRALGGDDIKRLVVTAQVSPQADLRPGVEGAAQFSVVNNNTFPVKLSSLTFDFSRVTVTPLAGQTCAPSNLGPGSKVGPTGLTPISPALVVDATSTSTAQSLAGALKLRADAPDGCQGATFTIPVGSVVAVTA